MLAQSLRRYRCREWIMQDTNGWGSQRRKPVASGVGLIRLLWMPLAKEAYSLEVASCTCIGRKRHLSHRRHLAHHTQHTTGMRHRPSPIPNMQLVDTIRRGAACPMHRDNIRRGVTCPLSLPKGAAPAQRQQNQVACNMAYRGARGGSDGDAVHRRAGHRGAPGKRGINPQPDDRGNHHWDASHRQEAGHRFVGLFLCGYI
jgi:hypothetical protein